MEAERRSSRLLLRSIVSTMSECNYAFFLGAGCSVSSGVKSAQALVKDFRALLFAMDNGPLFHFSETETQLLSLVAAVYGDDLLVHLRRSEALRVLVRNTLPVKRVEKVPSLIDMTFRDQRNLREDISEVIGARDHRTEVRIRGSADITLEIESVMASNLVHMFHAWLQEQKWYMTANEYSTLFEKLFALPSQRQAYIEAEVEYAKPYWDTSIWRT